MEWKASLKETLDYNVQTACINQGYTKINLLGINVRTVKLKDLYENIWEWG